MLELNTTAEFDGNMARLKRFDRPCADELRDVMRDCLRFDGSVPDSYSPHELNNPGGLYNGCMEFHLRPDVLVLYSPVKPRRMVMMRRICTHEELRTGHFGRQWPEKPARS